MVINNLFLNLPLRHSTALEWFLNHTGEIIKWPGVLPDGTLLATKAKGIYKPTWSPYTLSIRQNLNSKYEDKGIQRISKHQWQYKYCPELIDGKNFEDNYTNRAMLKNISDKVPLGILIQVQPKPHSRYEVLGLGIVKEWQGQFFFIESIDSVV